MLDFLFSGNRNVLDMLETYVRPCQFIYQSGSGDEKEKGGGIE